MVRFALAFALAFALLLGLTSSGRAQAPYAEPSARDIVVAYNTGLRVSVAPGLFIPTDGGRVGFSIAGDVRYGVEVGPAVIAPGLRLAGFFPSGFVSLTALATTRVTLPLGPVGPYVMGGVGPGYLSEPSHVGLAYQAGGGLMVHLGRSFALGAEVSYFGITGTDFQSLAIGPSLLIGY